MDTDDLSIEAYNAVILKSEYFHHDLTLQFGVLSSSCKNETEYLENSLLLISGFEADVDYAMDTIFFDNIPPRKDFISFLYELKVEIKKVQKIPFNKRTFEEW
ncbi:MAG TPA: hypothetical protein ENI57_08465 [Ignavibacteria bacterium]|nr:hypothetical protein [Ignavibacteria bacterium]